MNNIESLIIRSKLVGYNQCEIAKSLNRSRSFIIFTLRIAQLFHGYDFGLSLKRYELLRNKEELLKAYTDSTEVLSKKLKIEKYILRYALKYHNIPIKDWNEKAHQIQSKIRESKLPKEICDPTWLRTEYIDNKRGIDDIASAVGCSITAVRNRLKRFSIPIRPQLRFGHEKPISMHSHGICVSYTPVKSPKLKIQFRSILECGYAIYLDSLESVKKWEYESTRLNYQDGFSGKYRRYYCDFTIEYQDGHIENIEVKPKTKRIFIDKYLYAQHQLQGWRWITDEEIDSAIKFFSQPNLPVNFPLSFSNKSKKFVIWSKDNNLSIPNGFRVLAKRKIYGYYFKYHIMNDTLVVNKPKIIYFDKPNKSPSNGSIILDLDPILNLVKQDKSQKEIARIYGVNYRTIMKFLEDRSYVVKWSGGSYNHNEIRFATKLIWPDRELPSREKFYPWNNYEWLYQKYIVEKIPTRKLCKLVGVSRKLIIKKLKKHNINK